MSCVSRVFALLLLFFSSEKLLPIYLFKFKRKNTEKYTHGAAHAAAATAAAAAAAAAAGDHRQALQEEI